MLSLCAEITCLKCGFSSRTNDPVLDLSLNIKLHPHGALPVGMLGSCMCVFMYQSVFYMCLYACRC